MAEAAGYQPSEYPKGVLGSSIPCNIPYTEVGSLPSCALLLSPETSFSSGKGERVRVSIYRAAVDVVGASPWIIGIFKGFVQGSGAGGTRLQIVEIEEGRRALEKAREFAIRLVAEFWYGRRPIGEFFLLRLEGGPALFETIREVDVFFEGVVKCNSPSDAVRLSMRNLGDIVSTFFVPLVALQNVLQPFYDSVCELYDGYGTSEGAELSGASIIVYLEALKKVRGKACLCQSWTKRVRVVSDGRDRPFMDLLGEGWGVGIPLEELLTEATGLFVANEAAALKAAKGSLTNPFRFKVECPGLPSLKQRTGSHVQAYQRACIGGIRFV